MKKKVAAIISSVLLAGAVLAGCGGKTSASGNSGAGASSEAASSSVESAVSVKAASEEEKTVSQSAAEPQLPLRRKLARPWRMESIWQSSTRTAVCSGSMTWITAEEFLR